MRRGPFLLASLVALCGALLLAAFFWPSGSKGVSAEAVAGTWRGPSGAELVLRQDGTFSATNYPMDTAVKGGTPVAARSGSGRWEISSPRARGAQQIHIYFAALPAELGETGSFLRISGHGAGLRIYIDEWGSPNSRFTFKKAISNGN